MMGVRGLRRKADLKALLGKDFRPYVVETSLFGSEYREPGENTVVGPDAYSKRDWYATVTVDENGIITRVK